MSKWVPKLITLLAEYRTGQTPTAQQLNAFFNLLVEASNWNSEQLALISNEQITGLEDAVKIISEALTGETSGSLVELLDSVADLTDAYDEVARTTVNNTNAEIKESLIVGEHPVPSTDAIFRLANGADEANPKTILEVKKDGTILLDFNGNLKTLLDGMHPIGSCYTSSDPTNPSVLFGGVWKEIKGVCIFGVDTSIGEFATVDKVGGSRFLAKHTHQVTAAGTLQGVPLSATTTATSISTPAHNHAFSGSATPSGSVSVASGTITGWLQGDLVAGGGAFSHPSGTNIMSNIGDSYSNVKQTNFNSTHSHPATFSGNVLTISGTTGSTQNSSSVPHTHAVNILAHTHTFSGTPVTSSEAGTGTAGNLPPYITKYMWERIA